MPSSYKQWSTASTSYVRSSIVAGQGGGTTQNLTTFSGHPMSLTTWYVPDSVPEFLDIGDIRAIGHSGVANTSWFEIEITSRSAEFKTVTLENSPANLNCVQFRLIRSTSTTPLVNFVDGARLTESDLDKAYRQGLFAAQEVAEDAAGVGNLASLNLTLSGTTTVDNLTATGDVTSSGNLYVGVTTNPVSQSGTTTAGQAFIENAYSAFSRVGGVVSYFNRQYSDGTILEFRRDGSSVGSIGTQSADRTFIANANIGLTFNQSNYIMPCNASGAENDNSVDLGKNNSRFDDIYATNGTIQTSDRNEKQDIEELSEAEQRVAVVAKGLMRKFRWKDKVAEKGDNARTHFGIIAQDLQDAFTAEGLDAGDYAMFTSDTWTDDDGNEQTRLGVRYNQLLAFIISAL